MKWLSDNVDLVAVLLLAFLLAAGPSRSACRVRRLFCEPDPLSDVMRIDQIGELVADSVDQVLNCSAESGGMMRLFLTLLVCTGLAFAQTSPFHWKGNVAQGRAIEVAKH